MKKMLNSIFVFFIGIGFIIAFIVLASESPLQTCQLFFLKPFASLWYFGTMLNKLSLFLFAATGAQFALKTNNFNLGGEGQIYAAGLLTALLLQNRWQMPVFLQVFIVFALVFLISAGFGLFSGLLKSRYNINELVSSFLLSALLITLIDYAIVGVFRDSGGNLLATPPIDAGFRIRPFFSHFNISFIFALMLPALAAIFFSYTRSGMQLSVSGRAPEFARFSGFSVNAAPLVGLGVSSALHGMSGFFSITGTWYMCHSGFSAGMGWAALSIALIAGDSFLALIPAAFLYAWVETAADATVMSGMLSFNISIFFQAIVFLFVSAQLLRKNYRKAVCKRC